MKKFTFMLVLLAIAGMLMGQNLNEGFEGATVPPAGWTIVYANANPPSGNLVSHSTTQAYEGEQSFRFSSYSSGTPYDQYLITPELNASVGNSTISFYYRSYSDYGDEVFKVGWSSTDADLTSFTWSDEISNANTTSWQQYLKTDLPTDTKYVCIHYYSNYQYYLYVDTFVGPPIYIAPEPPSATTLIAPANEAVNVNLNPQLSWNAVLGADRYKISFGTDENSLVETVLGDITAWTSDSDLIYGQTYYWNIKAGNQYGYSEATETWSFTIMADPIISQFPWVETFTETTFPPLNWTRFNGQLTETSTLSSSTYGWARTTNFANTSGHPNGPGAKSNVYGTENFRWLVTPSINLDAVAGLKQIEFDLALTDWNNSDPPEIDGIDDKFAVVISTDNGETWSSANMLHLWDNDDATQSSVYNNISTTGERIVISLEGYSGTVKFGFYTESTDSNADNDLHIDNVQVRRTPTEAEFSVTPEIAEFPQTDVQSFNTQAFRVTNTGVSFLTLTAASITGPNANFFSIQNMPSLPTSINNQQEINFNVRYLPTAVGDHQATLRLTDNLGRAIREIPLTGSAIQPPIGANVRFPHVVSLPVSGFTANTGTYLNYYNSAMISPSSFYLNGPEYVARFTLNSDSYISGSTDSYSAYIFIVASEPNLTSPVPVLIGPSTSFTGQRLFAGTYYAIISGWDYLTENNTSAGTPRDFTLNLSAEALPPNPVFVVNPETKDFGDVNAGSNETQEFTISNGAGGNLQIHAITIEGDNAFSLSRIPNLPANISFMPDSNIDFTVQYAPTTEGEHNATVRVFDSMNRAIREIPLTGIGLPAEVTVDLALLNEGFSDSSFPDGWLTFNAGSGNDWTVQSTGGNPGATMKYIYNYSHPANAWAFSSGLDLTAGIQYTIEFDQKVQSGNYAEKLAVYIGTAQTVAGQTTQLYDDDNLLNTVWATYSVSFTPSVSGIYYLGFNCYSDENQYNLYVDNVKVKSLAPTMYVSPSSHNFGNTLVDTESSVKTFIAANAGLGSIELTGAAIVNRNNDFVIVDQPDYPVSLEENGTTFAEIGVKFTPTTAGEKSAVLRLTYDDGQTYDVEITGNAIGSIITTFPHHESFEDPAFPPIGWNRGAGDALNNWRVMNNISYAYDGNKSAMVGRDAGNYWLSTPGFEVTEQSKTFSFNMRKHSTLSSWDKDDEFLEVYISTTGNNADNFTAQPVLELGKDDLRLNYRKIYIDLEDYIGETIYIGFKRVATGGNFVYLDNVMINNDTPIFYGKPQNVQVTAGDGIVYINWEAPNTTGRSLEGYKVYRNNNAITNVITETSYIDTNVQNDVDYIYYVTAVYADYETAPTAPVTVIPSIPVGVFPPANLTYELLGNYVNLNWENPTPFFEGFESGVISEEWQNIDQDNDGQLWYVLTDQAQAFSGRRSIASASWTAATDALNPNNWLITPALVLKDNAVLSWAVGATDNQFFAENYQVKISTTGSDIADFTTNLRTETLTSAQWIERSINLNAYSGQTVYIAFVHNNSTENSSLKLDNIIVTNINNDEGSFASDFDTNEGISAFNMLTETNNRNLVYVTGYRVERDGVVIANLEADEQNYIDPDLDPDIYQYRVFALYGGMESTPATVNVEVLPLLPVPQNLSYTSDWNEINLEWEEPDFETERSLSNNSRATFEGYKVYRNNQPITGVIEETNYQDISLTAVDFYNYFVVAVYTNPNRDSGPSNQIQVTPMIPVYNPARNLLATSTYGLIVLNWEAPFEHTRGLRQAQRRETNNQVFESYTLYRNDEILAEEITDLTYADYDVQNGINYNYYVITNYSNPVGQSEASNSVISTPVIPTPATNFTALAGDSVVELAWEGPGFNRISGSRTNGSGFDGYYIYRDDVKLNTTPLQSFAYVDSAVVNYTSYTYYVTAVYHNPQTEIESAPTVSRTVMPELLTPPSNLQASILEYDVTLTWQEPNLPRNSRNLIGYNIYRDGVLQNQQLINNTNYVNVNVPVGPHTYTVTAVYDAQESVPSEAIEVIVIPLGDYTFPPVNVITSLNGNNIIVRWEAPFTYTGNLSNLLGYNVYRHLIEDNARTNAEFELLTETPITDLRFIDVNLEPGEYNYSVSAVYFINEEVQESELISSLPVVIDDLLPPTNLTYEFDEFAELDVILHWEAPAVETDRTVQSYKVYHNSIMLAQVTDLTYRHINAGIGSHEYAVSAVYNTGESAPLTIEVEINSQVIDEFPYVQGFEGNVLPLGWKTPFTGNVNGKWRQRNNEDFAYEGQKSVMSGNDFGQYWLVVNPVEITNESNTLSFFARDHSNITSMDKTDEFLHIKISTTNDSLYNFTSLATLDYRSLTTQYQQFMVDLSSYIGQTVYIALERVSTGGNYVYVDNFSFNNEELPVFNAPQNVVAQAGENIVNLEWQAPVVTETHILLAYQVYKNDDLIAEIVADPEQATYIYSDTDVQAFTSYDYAVKAVYTQGVASSETVQAMPYTLNSATDLIATSGDMQIALAWQAPVMNTSRNSISSSKYNRLSASNQRNLDLTLQGYQVYRNNIAITETVSDAEFVDTNVMPGVTYRYYVKAVYNLGVSSASNTAQAVAYQLIAPHTLTATEGLNRITLNWQYGISLVRNNKNELKSNQGQMKFNVYKDGEILASSITSRFYQDNAVVAGEEHTYYVTAVYRQGESQASENVTASAYDLQAPRELIANAGNRQVELVWTAPTYMNDDFFVGYKVYRNGVVIVENITDLTYTDLNLQANIVYNYRVSAVYVQGESEQTDPVMVRPYQFLAPRNLQARSGVNRISLTWSAPVSGLTSNTGNRPVGYIVYRNETAITETTTNLSYVDNDINVDTEYQYYVTAIYENPDGESNPSNIVTAIGYAPIFAAPVNITADYDNSRIVINWEAPITEKDPGYDTEILSGYRVYRDEEIIADNLTDLSFIDSNIRINESYTYAITAIYTDPDGESEINDTVTINFVSINDDPMMPLTTNLNNNYPNPFNPETTISFSLAKEDFVTIEIYNVKGSLVKTLVNGHLNAGNHNILWTGKDESNRSVASGMYFYRMKSGHYTATRKMIMIK